VFYPYPEALLAWRAAALGLATLVVSLLLLSAARRRPYLAAGWIWYVVTLLPMIGLIQVGRFSRADRFTYVPLIGVFFLLTWSACDWAGDGDTESPVCWRLVRAWSFCAPLSLATKLAIGRTTRACGGTPGGRGA